MPQSLASENLKSLSGFFLSTSQEVSKLFVVIWPRDSGTINKRFKNHHAGPLNFLIPTQQDDGEQLKDISVIWNLKWKLHEKEGKKWRMTENIHTTADIYIYTDSP